MALYGLIMGSMDHELTIARSVDLRRKRNAYFPEHDEGKMGRGAVSGYQSHSGLLVDMLRMGRLWALR